MNQVPPAHRDQAGQYWRKTRQLTMVLLGVWLLSSFAIVFFARELSALHFFDWPLGFYLAAQGAILIYLAIVGIYAWRMDKLDREARNDHHA